MCNVLEFTWKLITFEDISDVRYIKQKGLHKKVLHKKLIYDL